MRPIASCVSLGSGGLATLLGVALSPSVTAQVTQRVSVATNGAQQNADESFDPFLSPSLHVSPDGRYVAFASGATNLVSGDFNDWGDVFVRDRELGLTVLVSLSSFETQGNDHSFSPWISPDGRYVAFQSGASNLGPGGDTVDYDIFVRDRELGVTELVSVSSAGVHGNEDSVGPRMTPDARYVVFSSLATTLVLGDTNDRVDIFVRDRQLGLTERVNFAADGSQTQHHCFFPQISDDGRYVSFYSDADNLVAGDTNAVADVFVRDRLLGVTERVSLDSAGAESNGASGSRAISADGRYVVFQSVATNLVAGDTNAKADLFVRDRQTGTTERVSVSSAGVQGNGDSEMPWISSDGRYVAFESLATNLVGGDTNGRRDVFLRDRQLGTTRRVSVGSAAEQGNDHSEKPWISPDGRYVGFVSYASSLVPGDTNDSFDYFLRDRAGAPTFTSLCDPGVAGVIACPCANPPSGPGRGCDNSAATGGAVLSAAGGTYLSSDSLVFTTSGQKPTALSIVAQWIGGSSTGVAFGMGVRCTSGTFKRLFSKSAVAGSITVPDFGAGDPTISARSAAKGDPIQAGQSRWYVVYYRDTTVLGGCPATSNFNATQTGQVSWSP